MASYYFHQLSSLKYIAYIDYELIKFSCSSCKQLQKLGIKIYYKKAKNQVESLYPFVHKEMNLRSSFSYF